MRGAPDSTLLQVDQNRGAARNFMDLAAAEEMAPSSPARQRHGL